MILRNIRAFIFNIFQLLVEFYECVTGFLEISSKHNFYPFIEMIISDKYKM
jgi:hypothetical protein